MLFRRTRLIWLAFFSTLFGMSRRTAPGPRTPAEVATMIVTSAAIPPVACWHRLRGHARWRAVRRTLGRPAPGVGPAPSGVPAGASPERAAP